MAGTGQDPHALMGKGSQATGHGRVAVVTGGAQGLGWAICECLAEDGFHVVVADKSEMAHERAQALRSSGAQASGRVHDLAERASAQAMAADILRDFGRCDVLVNNAGTQFKTPEGTRYDLAEIRLQDWDASIALHMSTPLILSQAFLPGMKERRWGRVINMASRAGRTYVATGSASYSASKAGLVGLTRSIAGEYAPFGITCNALAPGRFKTALTARFNEAIRAHAMSELRVGREGYPREVGEMVRFLASENSGFITGTVLDINGGGFMAP